MVASLRDEKLGTRAARILRENDRGSWTKAAPELYPHQWSWDAAFIAIGWAHVDTARAFTELENLFGAQWATGMVPHIVFDPEADAASYFPGPDRWDCGIAAAAPASARTSGICQPPVHAIALGRIWAKASAEPDGVEQARRRLTNLFPQVVRWHRYLMTMRDPERSGLVTIYHPWESGSDNSPRWDTALAATQVGDVPPFRRGDTRYVDGAERPTDEEYLRYLWLVEVLKRCEYDDEAIHRAHPFLVKDVFFSALLVVANEVLLELADVVGASPAEREEITEWVERGRSGLRLQFDAELGMCLDRDVRTGAEYPVRTFAGFAPLIAGGMEPDVHAAQLAMLDSEHFLGSPKLRWPLVPTTSVEEPSFDPRRYWRGPVWPVITWVVWRSLVGAGELDRADALRESAIQQISETGFAEYTDAFSGEALGSDSQSWTAAAVLDWLSQ